MTDEHINAQALMELYLARLASLDTPGWSAEREAAIRQAGDNLVAAGPAGLEALRRVMTNATAPANARWQPEV
jgi:hypothetical protein